MKKKKVILTGGLGFIGSNLVELLIKKNFYVINLDKISYSSNFYNVKDFKKNKNYKFIKCDINNKSKIYQDLNKKIKPKKKDEMYNMIYSIITDEDLSKITNETICL